MEESKTEVESSAKLSDISSDNKGVSPSERSGSSREMAVSTLVHLLGLPTSQELGLLETKIDSVNSKLTSLSLKLDRLVKESENREIGSVLDRIDLQIADLRALIKKVLPHALCASEDLAIPDEGILGHGSQDNLSK